MPKSAIQEVRDQFSLDYATGKYLNVLGTNLGVPRPIFGFNESEWRAVVRTLAIEYKQIANKFRDFLGIVLGPQKTFTTTLLENAEAGDTKIYLSSVDNLPQLGVLLLDYGKVNAETVNYSLIDRETNAVFLTQPLVQNHTAISAAPPQPILAAYSNKLVLPSTERFPTSGFPYTIVVGAGTAAEEICTVSGNDTVQGVLTLSASLTNSHDGLYTTGLLTDTVTYTPGSFLVTVDDSTKFPSTGVIRINGETFNPFTATGGTTTTATLPASTLTTGRLTGSQVLFSGNVTAALENVVATIVSHSDTSITVYPTLPAAVASGDEFYINPVIQYIKNDYSLNSFLMRRDIPDLTLWNTYLVEEVKSSSTTALGQVICLGSDWDVYQPQPNLVELLVPESLSINLDIRAASYLHPVALGSTTTLSSGVSISDTQISVASTASFPLMGILSLNPSGVDERVGFWKESSTVLNLITPAANSHTSGSAVTLVEVVYVGTDLISGDPYLYDEAFPGPYVYDRTEWAPSTSSTSLPTLPGPTFLMVDTVPTQTALEVADASRFERSSFPYNIRVGVGTGNNELVSVTDVNLKQRVGTTVTSNQSAGVNYVLATALSGGPAGDGADFPNVRGYRVLVGRGTANEEVVYVHGTTTSPSNRLILESNTINPHTSGELVELLSDVLSVSALDDNHQGAIDLSKRSTAITGNHAEARYAFRKSTHEAVSPLLSALGIILPSSKDHAILNFGQNLPAVETTIVSGVTAGDTVLAVDSADEFPIDGIIIINPGSPLEEISIVSAVDTALDELEINDGSYGTKFDHPVGTKVLLPTGQTEVVEYTSTGFPTPIMLKYNHCKGELCVFTNKRSSPATAGTGFAFRMPTDPKFRFQSVLDLIRAAGIQVNLITKR